MFAIIHVHTEEIEDLGVLTSENKKNYAKRHGYKFIEFTKLNQLDLSKTTVEQGFFSKFFVAICWAKIAILRKALIENPEVEWFFWIDADAIFMNYHIKLENLVSEKAFFIVGRDCNGINLGTCFVRNCQRSHDFLEDVWNRGPQVSQTWWTELEQGQVDFFSQHEKYFDGFWTVPNKKFNSYFHNCHEDTGSVLPCSIYEPGDFVIHLPGQKNRLETIKKCLNYVVK
jgi:hypothetical protein